MLPDQFWSLTFFEFVSYSRSIREADSRAWWHTASLMSLHANLNRDSKKRPQGYKPSDFHPYGEEKKKAKFVRPKEGEVEELANDWANRLVAQKDGRESQ